MQRKLSNGPHDQLVLWLHLSSQLRWITAGFSLRKMAAQMTCTIFQTPQHLECYSFHCSQWAEYTIILFQSHFSTVKTCAKNHCWKRIDGKGSGVVPACLKLGVNPSSPFKVQQDRLWYDAQIYFFVTTNWVLEL